MIVLFVFENINPNDITIFKGCDHPCCIIYLKTYLKTDLSILIKNLFKYLINISIIHAYK